MGVVGEPSNCVYFLGSVVFLVFRCFPLHVLSIWDRWCASQFESSPAALAALFQGVRSACGFN